VVTGDRLSTQGILRAVVRYVDAIAPHDLRRTFAKLAFKGGTKLDQIQLSMGHASIQPTERYLGVEQDLTDAPLLLILVSSQSNRTKYIGIYKT
jgi:integrase